VGDSFVESEGVSVYNTIRAGNVISRIIGSEWANEELIAGRWACRSASST
jgi:hypothetical protein